MTTCKSDSSLLSEKIHPDSSLPSLGSDEESFVVLWKDTDGKPVRDSCGESDSGNLLREAKSLTQSLINKELTEDQSTFSNKVQSQTENKLSLGGSPNVTDEIIVECSQLDKLMVLSNMQLGDVEIDQDTSGVISITTLSADLTSEQVQKKISDLIEENTRLKYIIVQNNATMKSQCQKIVAWQEDVQKVHDTHRKKIIEAKGFIEKLKVDKHNLTRELEQTKDDKKAQEEVLREKEHLIQEKLSRSTDVDTEVTGLKLAINNLTMSNTILNANIKEREKEVAELQTGLYASRSEAEEAKAELSKTKSVYDDELKSLNLIIDTLKSQEYSLLTSSVNSEARFRTTDNRTATYAQIENLNKEVLELRSKVDKSETQMDEIHALKAQLELYKADFEAEKSAKKLLQIEKGKLLEDILKLQGNYNKLQEKMNTIRDKYIIVPKSQEIHHQPDEECCIQ